MDNINPQSESPVVAPIASPHRPKTRFFLFVAILLGLGILAGFLYLQNSYKTLPQSKSQNGPIPTISSVEANEPQFEIIDGDLYKTSSQGKEMIINKKTLNRANNLTDQLKYLETKEIDSFKVSPGKSKLFFLVYAGLTPFLLFYSDINGQEITFIDITANALWSPNSRYIAYTTRVADIGPFNLHVFDTNLKKNIDVIQSENEKNISYEELKWASDSASLSASFETYNSIPHGKIIDKGETVIRIK